MLYNLRAWYILPWLAVKSQTRWESPEVTLEKRNGYYINYLLQYLNILHFVHRYYLGNVFRSILRKTTDYFLKQLWPIDTRRTYNNHCGLNSEMRQLTPVGPALGTIRHH